jgi:APA family basic amino acid/polyamine antiporter
MSSPSAAAKPTGTLLRGLTLLSAAALIVTNVIGTGVFVKARVMTCYVGSPTLVLLAYVAGGLLTLAGALSLAELSAMMPRSGGMYNYIGAAFGRTWAFLFGWTETFIDSAGSAAAIAIVFVIFLNDFLGGRLSALQTQLFVVGVLLAIVLLNLAKVHANGVVATLITALKVLLVAGVGIVAFVFGDGSFLSFAAGDTAGACEGVAQEARFGSTGFGAAVIGALWSYNGWTVATFVAEEIRDPGHTLPRAMIGSSVLLIALYVLANAGYFYVLSASEVGSVPETSSVAAAVLTRVLGASGAMVMTAGMMISSIGALHSTILTGARLPFAMARDKLLPASLAKISPHSHVPIRGVLLVGAFAIAMALSGTFDMITDMVVFALLIFNGLAVAAVYVLRRKLPDAERPYRTWGYPVVPALFLAATVYLMLNTLLATPGRALAGLGIIALGLPVYAWYAHKLPHSKPEDWLPNS